MSSTNAWVILVSVWLCRKKALAFVTVPVIYKQCLAQVLRLTLVIITSATLPAVAVADESLSGQVMPLVDAEHYAVTPYITLLEDPASQWNIEEVSSSEFTDKFTDAKQNYLNFGYSDSTYWIRLQLRYEPNRKRHPPVTNWYFEVGKAQLNTAELYVQREDGSLSRYQADIRIPYAERPLRMVNSVFPITTPKGETITLYLRVKNISAFYIPLTIWEPGEFVRKTTSEEFLYGAFFGGMLIMIVYNLFLYVSIRDLSYVYYSAYLVSALVFEAIDLGHGAAWHEEGRTWFNKEYVPIAIWCTWLSSFLFTRRFLEIPKRHPLLNQFLTPLFIFSLICAAFCFMLPFKLSLVVSVYFCGYAVSTMPLVGAYVWYKGNKSASYFTLAWIFNVTGFIILSSVATGRAPATPLFIASMPLGTWLEAVMLSFALAERIKRTQKETLQANTLSMQHLAGYRSLIDNALEGIYQMTLRGRLINANPALAQILGFPSVKKLLHSGKKTVHDIFDDPARQWRELMRGKPVSTEIHRLRADGSAYVAMHSAYLVRDTHGQASYIEGKLVNITERFEREQAERERVRERHEKAKAEALTQAKSRFLKNMSFEIRSSLAPIIGFSESLKSSTLPAEAKSSAINTIVANAQTLLQLVNDILDFSKIEAGKMPIEQIDTDLLHLLAGVNSQFVPQARQKSLTFEMQYDWPLPPRISSDPTRLKQILQNLCSNAIKHTYHGKVTLRVYWDAANQQLCFDVSDTGPGLTPKDLGLLQHTNSSVASSDVLQRGGLGIAITRQLTQMLGGSLRVKSIQDQGSTFTASISGRTPSREKWVSSAEITTKKSTAARKVPQLSGRVLLAEDNLVNQKLIARIIGKTGVEAVVVSDGEQARNAALSSPFDLILMDVNMPVLGGLEATRILREKGYDGPIYALTAEHGLEEIRASMNAGCNGHLTKPIDIEAFYEVLASCLHEQEAQNA